MRAYLQTTLLLTLALGRSHRLDTRTRPKCCSDSRAPAPPRPQDWVASLREATYRSLTRHLDYAGGLDGRLDRDHKLWQLLQKATFTPPPGEPDTGVVVQQLRNGDVAFEFRSMDKSLFDCIPGLCDLKNDSVIALWRVRRSDHPYAVWIQVKLPKIKDHPTEDVYEYSTKYGLKKLNPDPVQYNSFEKPHRFTIPRGKSSFRNEERMDIPFPNVFGIGRVTPTSFIYDPPVVASKGEEGWIVSAPRRPHPGVIVNAGIKGANAHPPYHPHPFKGFGSKGFHHLIHSLPSVSPPQNLDHPHNIKGFLPSVGPVNAPPPYKMEYVYDPRYVLYYNDRPDLTSNFPTRPPKQFKPSTEFVHYSELDPFYHPRGEQDMLSTTPIPFHNFHTTGFPQSINDQLPTNTPIEHTRPPFQIIVGDDKPPQRTTTNKPKSVDKPFSTTESPKNRFFSRPRTKTTERPETLENKITTKPFGEKIKPKTPPSIPKTTTRTREKLTTRPFLEGNKKKNMANIDKKKTIRNDTELSDTTELPQIVKQNANKVNKIVTSTIKNFATVPTTPIELTDTTETETDHESTTEGNEEKTTYSKTETTEIFNEKNRDSEKIEEDEEKKFTEKEDKITTIDSSFMTTEMTTLEESPTDTSETKHRTKNPEREQTTETFPTTETSEPLNKTLTLNTTSGISDFFSSLTDSLFSMGTTTERNEEATIDIAPKAGGETADADTQESKQHNFRLVTFPGDTVSIVANHISQSVSYRTADGKQGQLRTKNPTDSRFRFSDAYKDYSTIL